jgi:hypothetical protein
MSGVSPATTPNSVASASNLVAYIPKWQEKKGLAINGIARMEFLQKQQAEIEQQLNDPYLSRSDRWRLARQKDYWGRAIQQMLASPGL